MGFQDTKLDIGHTQYLAISTHIEEVLVEQKPSETCQQSFFVIWGDGYSSATLTSSELKGSNYVPGLDGHLYE